MNGPSKWDYLATALGGFMGLAFLLAYLGLFVSVFFKAISQ